MALASRAARRLTVRAAAASPSMRVSLTRVPVRGGAAMAAPLTAFGGRQLAPCMMVAPVEQLATRGFASDAAAKLGPMNGDIRAHVVNIVGDDGEMRRDVSLADALQEAEAAGVDLVQVANNNGQVVCRLFDAQKRLFSLKKALKQSKPKQNKEVTFGVKTEAHDIKTKAAQVRSFLSKGHKVKVTVKFGKEFHLLDRAIEQLQVIEETVGSEVGAPDHKPQNQYGRVYVHFVPRSSK